MNDILKTLVKIALFITCFFLIEAAGISTVIGARALQDPQDEAEYQFGKIFLGLGILSGIVCASVCLIAFKRPVIQWLERRYTPGPN